MRSIPATVLLSATLAWAFIPPSLAQTIRLGPGGVEIAPNEPPPPPPPAYREEIPRGERRLGPPPGVRDPLRVQMFQLREACEGGDRRACVRLGVVIGENRERRAQWRRENPELFFYER